MGEYKLRVSRNLFLYAIDNVRRARGDCVRQYWGGDAAFWLNELGGLGATW